jgi:hypothetical protein
MLRAGLPFYHQRTEGIHAVPSSMKQKITPEAKALLESVLPKQEENKTE